MPTARGWAAAGVAAALLVLWAGFGERELMAAAVFLLAAVAVGMLFVRLSPPAVTVGRRLYPDQVHEGDMVTVEIGLDPARRMHNVFLEDTVHGLGVARFAAARTSPGEPGLARYEVLCRRRGVYPVGPAELAVTDPLALVELRRAAGTIDRLVVYPRIDRLRGLPAVRGYDPAVQATRPTFAPTGGDDFFTLREYQLGDDLRKVHWPSTAKRDELVIKQLELPWQARALVLLDPRRDRYPDPDHFQQAVRGAASVVAHMHRGGFSPELLAPPLESGAHRGHRYQQAMETLAMVEPVPHLDLGRAVSRLRRRGVGGGVLVLVTGIPDESVLSAYRFLHGHFNRTVVMAVADGPSLTALEAVGAVTVVAGAETSWTSAWSRAMERSWSTASVG